MLYNFERVGLIYLALPNARIIHTRRDPRDTALSCFSILFNEGHEFTYDLAELGRYIHAYQALMEHWRQVLPEGFMLEVQYEDVVDISKERRDGSLPIADSNGTTPASLSTRRNDRSVPRAILRCGSRSIRVQSGAGALRSRASAVAGRAGESVTPVFLGFLISCAATHIGTLNPKPHHRVCTGLDGHELP